MGDRRRKGPEGVEVRPASVRVLYTIPGVGRRRQTLTLDGVPIAPTPANIRHAARLADEIRAKIRAGTFRESDYFGAAAGGGPTTVDQQIQRWLGTLRIADSTLAGYESARRFWSPSIGAVPISELLPSRIQQALAARPDLSGKTANNYVSVLREALALAITDGVLGTNPADKVPRAKHQKEPPDPFTRDEADRICAWMDAQAPAQVANLVRAWMWTGMRTSEAFGLRWSSIDLQRREATISEALVRGRIKSSTKTSVARIVRLNSAAAAAIERQRAHTQLAGGPVFTDPRTGGAWHEERAFRRSFWEPCLRALQIRYRRPYTMRHTYATRMLEAGMTPAYCARQLGHSVEIFLTTYARWIDGDLDSAEMARLEASIVPRLSPGTTGTGPVS